MDAETLTQIAASGMGAAVFAILSPDRKSWVKTLASVVVGLNAGIWLAPMGYEYQGITSPAQIHAVHFVTGLIGNPLCRLILNGWLLEKIRGMIAKDLPNGDNGPRQKRVSPDSDSPPAA